MNNDISRKTNNVLANPVICFALPRKTNHTSDSNTVLPSVTLTDYGLGLLTDFIIEVTERGDSIETPGQTPTAA